MSDTKYMRRIYRCTCCAIDNGVGIMHEPLCGWEDATEEVAALRAERDAALARAEAAEKERGTDTGYDCTLCGLRIYGVMRGNGDGTGNRFAHDACWWRKEAEALAEQIKAGTETEP